ncbi:MAG TPA: pyridoxamine 5'-phosphate oxidase family protein, partial [Acidimicrobiia bacterium]|nr:pyridoxamine 5'-phosphate oxidase family protein [Acidimicrobiia bacterium]
PRVAFEADNPHPADGWSVVVTGPAAEVSDGEVAPASLTAAGAPDDPTPTRLFRLTSEKVSGRQLLRPPLYVGGTVRTGVASVHPSHDAPPAGMVGDPLDCPSRPLPVETCRRLVATAEVGRLAILEDGEPGIFPVNFAVDGDAVVFRTAPGTKLESIARSAVAFEVDHLPAGSGTGWSVVLNGFAEEVTSAHHPGLREHLASLAVRPWAPGERIHFVRLVPSAVSGTRYGEASGAG